MSRKNVLLILSIFVVGFFIAPYSVVLASTTNGTISGYAWSSQIGWVNFGTTNGNVHITDSAMTGYAWNENFGNINLNPTNGGVVNNSEGTLSGKAWLEGIGWINFSGVSISSTGVFSGTATGDNSTSFNFSCDHCSMTTDWRPASSRTTSSTTSASTGGGPIYNPPTASSLNIKINNDSSYTNNQSVILVLGALDATKMMLSNSADFSGAVREDYQTTKSWTLNSGDGVKTVYVRFYTVKDIASSVLSDSITLDTQAPQFSVNPLKKNYFVDENILVSGLTESYGLLTFFIDGRYGSVNADNWGNLIINLGSFPLGDHTVEFTVKDSAGNVSVTKSFKFTVIERAKIQAPVTNPLSPFTLAPPLAPILRKLTKSIEALLPKFFNPIVKQEPRVAITVPVSTPVAFKLKFTYLSGPDLSKFVLAPLPDNVKILAQKFPQLSKTLQEVGIQKFTDIKKLENAKFQLPNLTQSVLSGSDLAVGNFSGLKGIPVAKLSAETKNKIPSEIVFAKVDGGLVDLNVALSLNSQGKTEQKITTIVGHQLQLVVRTDKPVKRIHGYVAFKSKKYNQPAYLDSKPSLYLNNMTASLMFANPVLSSVATPNNLVAVEGGKTNNEIGLQSSQASGDLKVTNIQKVNVKNLQGDIEQRFVLSEFEYVDSGSGVYTALIDAPVVDGEYEIITTMDFQDPNEVSKEIKLITLVDPEGYIYEKNGISQTRITGAVTTLFWLNPDTKKYETWNAKEFLQENPQVTDVRGTYSFLVPEGYYYLIVDAPGYTSYIGKPFEVKEGSGIHTNIELKVKYWWLKFLDWKTSLLVLVIALLGYNFYKNRNRSSKKAL